MKCKHEGCEEEMARDEALAISDSVPGCCRSHLAAWLREKADEVEGVKRMKEMERLKVSLGACTESRASIIEMMIGELDNCATSFEACSRDGYPCGCGTAAKNVRALAMRLRAQRPNDGRSKRCGIRLSGESWCVLDVGHSGDHAEDPCAGCDQEKPTCCSECERASMRGATHGTGKVPR